MAQVQAEHSVLINRPVEDVFAYVADQTNEPKWHTDVLDVSPAGTIELGRMVTWQLNYMGKNEYVVEVTAFEPNRRIEMTVREGPLKPTMTNTFEPMSGQTRYTRRIQIPLTGMFRLVGPILKLTGAGPRRNARFARNLKELLER